MKYPTFFTLTAFLAASAASCFAFADCTPGQGSVPDPATFTSRGGGATLWMPTADGSKTNFRSMSFDSYSHCTDALNQSAELRGTAAHCTPDR